MTSSEINIEVVRKYFNGCNSGNIEDLMSTLAHDVTHYFLHPSFPSIKGAEHLAKYWAKYKRLLNPIWKIDHIIAHGNEVVTEWSCIWTPNGTQKRLMARGSEWYVMRDARILEVRAYFISSDDSNVEFATFPYKERGYLIMD